MIWKGVINLAKEFEKKIKAKVKKDKLRENEKYCRSLEKALLEKEKEVEAIIKIQEHQSDYVIKQENGHKKLSATCFLLLSDVHCDEIIKPKTVNFLNSFCLDTADQRITKFFLNSLRLIQIQKKDLKIDKAVLCLLGDNFSSNIHEELLENTSLRPIEACLWIMDRLEAGIKLLRDNIGVELIITCNVGNHSRITKKIHHSTETGNSLEFMLYHFLAKKIPDVTFLIADGYHLYLQVYDKVVRLMHGHGGLRYFGGIGGLTIPLNRGLAQFDKAKKADYTFLGHFHTRQSGGNWRVNGSLIGYSPFSIFIRANYEPPVQSYFCLLSNGHISNECVIFLDE